MDGLVTTDNCDNIFAHLKVFTQFVCEEKVHSIEEVINASVVLLKHCTASRLAVLNFFGRLFHEYCYEYCLSNGGKPNINADQQELPFLQRFVQALNKNQAEKIKKSEDASGDRAEIKSLEDGPQSPSKEISEDFEMEDLTMSMQKESDLSVIIGLLDRYMICKLEEVLAQVILVNDLDANSISDWALDLASEISKKFSPFVGINPDKSTISPTTKVDHLLLTSALGFWLQCSAMQVLIGVILGSASASKTNAKTLINRLLRYSPHSDWILAYMCTNISQSFNLADYIEQLISDASSYSVTFILSYVSEHNPHAIVNCSKSNFPLLLQLCTNSKPLLDLLANEIVKKVNVKGLNQLAELHTSDEINDYIIYCVLNAPNAFELLKISFDLVVHPQTSEVLCHRILKILSLVTMQIHNHVYGASDSSDNMFPIVSLLRNNIQQLISHPSISRNTSLKKLQLRLLNLICIRYGCEFITEVFHHLMNVQTITIGTSNYENLKLNSLLLPLYNKLRLHFGHQIENCIKDTLKLHYMKKLTYWAFLSQFIETNSTPLDIADLTIHLSQISYNRHENLFRKYYILRILNQIFYTDNKLFFQQQYTLCINLVDVFFELIGEMQKSNPYLLVIILNSITLCQKLLSNLSAKFNLNEQIIARHILDFIQEKNRLFVEEYSVFADSPSALTQDCKNLLNENLIKFSHHTNKHKKSRLPYHKLHRRKERIQNKCVSLNKQLVIDLLQSCIRDKASFAKNFVNSLSSELMLNDMPWLEEDPKDGQIQHLKMTFERDLIIARLFEDKPILWNIFEIIIKGHHLTHCFVIIRAMVNVLRANLASSTFRSQNIDLTQRIITLMAKNEILPRQSFIHIPELVPKVKSWEMSYVLHDIAKFMRDSNSIPKTKTNAKPYLERLRIILALQHPSELYAKIFKYL